MDPDYSFMDMSHYGPTDQLSSVSPSITHHAQHAQHTQQAQPPLMMPNLLQPLHSVPSMLPSKVGKRQTNRVKYTDEEVQRICSMKEAGWPWRFVFACGGANAVQ